MKMKISIYHSLLLILTTFSNLLFSQAISVGKPAFRVMVCTDRTLYITGEKILFSAFLINEDESQAADLSKILYCELITPDGNRVAGGKYHIENSSAQGCLAIPEGAITGIYYLKSYTRFMRNGSQYDYHFKKLKIINPYKNEVLSGPEFKDNPLNEGTEEKNQQPVMPLSISTIKRVYSCREQINLKIEGYTFAGPLKKLCLSVIPEMAFEAYDYRVDTSLISSGEIQYYPETRGISLSGRLMESGTGLPVQNALVNLSIIGDKDAMAIRTNASGQFYFALPGYSANKDLFLCSEDIPGISTEILIDNDFCSRPLSLPAPRFQLTEEEKETAFKMALNQKISSVFPADTSVVESPETPKDIPFYGEPTEILKMDTYIDLPTIEEYFFELIGIVNIRKSEGRKHFRFISTRVEMTIYDPLVLIDWVAVNDAEKILAMLPRAIDRIELVNAPYIKGNITYGGIISFISRKNDFAGIDLPTSGTFINYKFLDDCSLIIPASAPLKNIPDSRNTLYWNPDIQTDDKGSAEISFTAPDTPGEYIILLQGINHRGEIVVIRERIEVAAD
jgi:hypothetical protein